MPAMSTGTDLRWDQFPSHQQLHSGTLLRAVGLYIPKLNNNQAAVSYLSIYLTSTEREGGWKHCNTSTNNTHPIAIGF